MDLLPGVLDFLEALKKSRITLYIGTGTFRSVAQKVTERLGVRSYFKDVYGAVISAGPKEFPNGKVDMLRKVKSDLGISWHDELMIVGDGHGNQGEHEVRLRAGRGCHSWFAEPATEQLS